jgi:hypothetical protein
LERYTRYYTSSWLCELCSYFVCESRNRRINVFSKRETHHWLAYLQDHNADILFDDNGLLEFYLFSELNDKLKRVLRIFLIVISTPHLKMVANFKLDTTQNANGYFNIDTRQERYILALIMQAE